jgi:membrane protein DedA with SNARE-associated domain
MFDSVANAVSGSPWTYLLLAAVCAGDALFPVLPSETVVIAAAVLAAHGHLNIGLVVSPRPLAPLLVTTQPTRSVTVACGGWPNA